MLIKRHASHPKISGRFFKAGIQATLLATLITLQGNVLASDYSPYVGNKAPTKLLWGDTHLHTSVSTDAAARGNRLGLDAAYRFARGEEVTSSSGLRAKLKEPLDFVVIADHSDGMGFFGLLKSGHPELMAHEVGRRWRELLTEGKGLIAAREIIGAFSQGTLPWKTNDTAMMKPVWEANVQAAEQFNQPGVFTALIGYEWTSLVKGNNLHRVVIYRDGADKVLPVLPYTLEDSADPEDLWRYLAAYESKTEGAVLAIPHNSNLSNGMMFADVTLDGGPLSADYAQRRSRWEPLIEISQIKGDSEAHPSLSPDDEFADFETWDRGNLDLSEKKTKAMLNKEYARAALKRGLALEQQLGANPFEFGIIASTDSHTSLAAVGENNFFGKHTKAEPNASRASTIHRQGPVAQIMGWEQVSSGYAAVWATDNTRESIWDAMKRKETYGTTGSRIAVRLFGGWRFDESDALSNDLAATGYAKGVPMGGTLTKQSERASPTFLVAAQRDPSSANLDRIQIIKGWLDSQGKTRERVYNVAWSGQRELTANGGLPPVGNTVDIASASYSNSIGQNELIAVWKDPDFNVNERAFYYARVLEIPTPRWPAYDALRLGAELPKNARLILQERAYTSPIWYKP